jgi:hypothetical protein
MLHKAGSSEFLDNSREVAEELLRLALGDKAEVVCVPSHADRKEATEEAGAEEAWGLMVAASGAIITSGVLTAAYRLLETWVKARNGRKLKIKVGDIEVEATQMDEKDVIFVRQRRFSSA